MAFPDSTAIIDDFDRANSATLGAKWTEGDLGGDTSLNINTNRIEGGTANQVGDAYWNDADFGADTEAYFTLVVLPFKSGDRCRIVARAVDHGDATWEGYTVDLRPSSDGGGYQMVIQQVAGGTSTELSSKTNVTISDGHKQGIEVTGGSTTTIKAWHFDGSTWNEIVSFADTTSVNENAGSVGLIFEEGDDQPLVDDFFAGTISAAGGRIMSSLAGRGGLAGPGGIAGYGGGLAG